MFALISGGYEVAAFFGLPPYADSPYTKTVAFLVFAGALLRIITTQSRELDLLRKPNIEIHLEPKGTKQFDQSGSDGMHWRIAVTNKSELHSIKDCRLVIESWTLSVPSLNSDTALIIKDEPATASEIHPLDTKQFNVFTTWLYKDTGKPAFTTIWAPNNPRVASESGGYAMTFRLTGQNIHTRRYRALLLMDNQKQLSITRVDELD